MPQDGATPSPPDPSTAPRPRRVLLLIDTQVALLAAPPLGVPSAHTTGPNIASVLAAARSAPAQPLVVHVRNHGGPGEVDEAGTPGWQLAFPPLFSEPVVDKLKNNAFVNTALAELIPPDAQIVVVGCQSDFCVRATCSAALARGNEVALVRGAHATYDRVEPWNYGTTPAATVEAEIEDELEEAGVIMYEMKDVPQLFVES